MIFYTDGSASPNPGPGGYAVIDQTGQPLAVGAEKMSTNIRMEAFALIAALELADGNPCKIYTDSEFWVNVLTRWAKTWAANGWTKKNGQIKNLELVQKTYKLYTESQATLLWVKGHSDNQLNAKVDSFANQARKGLTLAEIKAKEKNA